MRNPTHPWGFFFIREAQSSCKALLSQQTVNAIYHLVPAGLIYVKKMSYKLC